MPKDEEKKEKPQKGVAGENTGGKARAAIKKAKARSATNESIGAATNRSASTIGQIERGSIKNPPADLHGKVGKAKSVKEKREDMVQHMTFNDSLKEAISEGEKARNRS